MEVDEESKSALEEEAEGVCRRPRRGADRMFSFFCWFLQAEWGEGAAMALGPHIAGYKMQDSKQTSFLAYSPPSPSSYASPPTALPSP